MNKTLSVSAIQNGTVIDHIASCEALRIIRLLQLLENKRQITVGLNLPSKRLGLKDLIKIENHVLTKAEANEVIIFAPQATINIIKNFEVVEKMVTSLPASIKNVFICPNVECITHIEPIESVFMIAAQSKKMNLTCKYCEKTFDRSETKVEI